MIYAGIYYLYSGTKSEVESTLRNRILIKMFQTIEVDR